MSPQRKALLSALRLSRNEIDPFGFSSSSRLGWVELAYASPKKDTVRSSPTATIGNKSPPPSVISDDDLRLRVTEVSHENTKDRFSSRSGRRSVSCPSACPRAQSRGN